MSPLPKRGQEFKTGEDDFRARQLEMLVDYLLNTEKVEMILDSFIDFRGMPDLDSDGYRDAFEGHDLTRREVDRGIALLRKKGVIDIDERGSLRGICMELVREAPIEETS